MRRSFILAAAVLFSCGLAYGEEQPGPSREHLKSLSPYIGTWRWHGTLEEDFPFAEAGETGTATFTLRWVYNKNAIDWRWEMDYPSKQSGTKGTFAWDASQKKLIGFGVSSDGSIIRVTGSSLNPLILYVEDIDPDGKKSSHVETFTPSGDSMKIKSSERKGSTLPEDSMEYVFKRVERSDQGVKRSRKQQ